MQVDLAQDEINMIVNMLKSASIGLLEPNSLQLVGMAQSIVQKFQNPQSTSNLKGE